MWKRFDAKIRGRCSERHQDALGEEAIEARNQFANVGNPSEGRRESDAEERILRNLRERNPCQGHCTDGHKSGGPKHHGGRFGGSHAKFEAPLPGPRCHNVAGHLQIVLAIRHQEKR